MPVAANPAAETASDLQPLLDEMVTARQLSAGDLALVGTLQAALNEVTKKASTNPLAAVQALSTT